MIYIYIYESIIFQCTNTSGSPWPIFSYIFLIFSMSGTFMSSPIFLNGTGCLFYSNFLIYGSVVNPIFLGRERIWASNFYVDELSLAQLNLPYLPLVKCSLLRFYLAFSLV